MTDTHATPINAHAWDREKHEHYVEPHWCSERLLEEENFEGPIWDPCCGFGRIPDAAVKAGLGAIGTDIVDRGWRDLHSTRDFIQSGPVAAGFDIVCNPPFNLCGRFARQLAAEVIECIAGMDAA